MTSPEQRSTPAGETGATSKPKEQLKDTSGGVDAASLLAYLDAGWQPFPLPYRAKSAPPRGYTGGGALPVTPEVIADWADAPRLRGCSGVGLRMPDGVIALDVDAYHGGADTIAGLEAKLGSLPETPINTSRDDGSGHRCFRVDPALSWISEIPGEGKLKSGVEILAPTHRYAVVGPSLHKDTGLPYAWSGGEIPRVADLPELPAMWVDFLRMIPPTPYIDTSPERPVDQGIHPYAKGAVTAEIARLEECEMLGEAGPLWDNTTFGVACNLLEFANSNWSGHTLESVHSLFMQKAPVDDDFGPLAHKSKWDSAVIKVGGGGREYPEPTALADFSEPLEGTIIDRDATRNLLNGQNQFALRLVEYCAGTKNLYVRKGFGWMYFNGVHWEDDELAHINESFYETVALIASNKPSDPQTLKLIHSSTSATGVAGILKLASDDQRMLARMQDFDADPNLLNVQNGTLDLRTLELRPHDPADRLMKVARARFDPDLDWRNTRWGSFMEEILPDPVVREYVQRYVGQALVGTVREHMLPVLSGVGANGKTNFYESVGWALGGYAVEASPKIFLENKNNDQLASPMILRGARWVAVSETGKGVKMSSENMKLLTGGDPITARLLYHEPITFNPSHSAVFITNHPPLVDADDRAVWRRLRLVEFTVQFEGARNDLGLKQRLRDDPDAILAWAVEGLREYRRIGMKEPKAVKRATEQYRTDNDVLADFIETRTEPCKGLGATATQLHEAYKDWCFDNRLNPDHVVPFRKTMEARGYVANVNPKKGTRWINLAVHPNYRTPL